MHYNPSSLLSWVEVGENMSSRLQLNLREPNVFFFSVGLMSILAHFTPLIFMMSICLRFDVYLLEIFPFYNE
jgi:hypothetical protein